MQYPIPKYTSLRLYQKIIFWLCVIVLVSWTLSYVREAPQTAPAVIQQASETSPNAPYIPANADATASTASATTRVLSTESPSAFTQTATSENHAATTTYTVTKVVDGDTIDVSMGGTIKRIRLIGINTPETVDPRKPVECFGTEASNRAKAILTGTRVSLVSDPSQDNVDKYGRLLRYVFLKDGTNFNLKMIQEGYAYEYTYHVPYEYQQEFKQAQKDAQAQKLGLWGVHCDASPSIPTTPAVQQTSPDQSSESCTIKGNINDKGVKIYHVIGCPYYDQTVINENNGERWFCSEQDALNAGWRKALDCN